MSRKCRYTPQIQEKFSELIHDGFTITDACYGMGISVSTFNRWRNRYPDFDEAINKATSRQWENPIALARYGCRQYTRKYTRPNNYPSPPQKPLYEPIRAPQTCFTGQDQPRQEQMMYGLPVGDMYSPNLETGKTYYDSKLGKVFYRDKNRCLSSMPLHLYLSKKQKSTPFIGVIV